MNLYGKNYRLVFEDNFDAEKARYRYLDSV